MIRLSLLPLVLAALTAACSPTLDWRQVRPDDSNAEVLFPCKPRHETRDIVLAGGPVAMTIYACSAGGVTWAFGYADVIDPARVGTALSELGDAAARNVEAGAPAASAVQVPGMTPHPQARRLALAGRMPDGTPVRSEVALFSRGTVVFQATVVGDAGAQALETFFSALRADA